jgi:hypothetical protein
VTRLLEIAEAPAAHLLPRHPKTVVGDGFIVSPFGPSRGAVQQIRLTPDEVPAAIEATRAIARESGWSELAWWVTELSEPVGLEALLGFDSRETFEAMAISEPPSGEQTVEVTRVETLEDFVTAQEIDLASIGWSEERILEARDGQTAAWERLRDTFLLWLAHLDGVPVGFGRAAAADGALMLIGGGTLAAARGRGVYRSLVHARWGHAVAAGTPALVVQANAESGRILDALGFERVGEIRLLVDRL